MYGSGRIYKSIKSGHFLAWKFTKTSMEWQRKVKLFRQTDVKKPVTNQVTNIFRNGRKSVWFLLATMKFDVTEGETKISILMDARSWEIIKNR